MLLSTKAEDDMGTLLCLMQKEPPEAIKIKIAILKVNNAISVLDWTETDAEAPSPNDYFP